MLDDQKNDLYFQQVSLKIIISKVCVGCDAVSQCVYIHVLPLNPSNEDQVTARVKKTSGGSSSERTRKHNGRYQLCTKEAKSSGEAEKRVKKHRKEGIDLTKTPGNLEEVSIACTNPEGRN